MFKLNFLMKCCCDHQSNEEERQEKIPNPIQTNPLLKDQSEISQKVSKSEDSVKSIAIDPVQLPVYPSLLLKIIESSAVEVGTILRINGVGLENSLRSKQDFKVFIGNTREFNGEILNDFVIPEESVGLGKQHILLKFDPSTNKYTLSDLGDGTGTFVKIVTNLAIQEEHKISFASTRLKVGSVKDKLNLKFLEGPKADEEFIYCPQDRQVIIGRMNDCSIKIDDVNLSRYQCSIKYQNREWVLRDGFNNKSSTNGTWVFVEGELEIYDKMIFKAGKTLFEATLDNLNRI